MTECPTCRTPLLWKNLEKSRCPKCEPSTAELIAQHPYTVVAQTAAPTPETILAEIRKLTEEQRDDLDDWDRGYSSAIETVKFILENGPVRQ